MKQLTWGVIMASGQSQQLAAGADIAFLSVGSLTALVHVMNAFEANPEIDGLVVTVRPERIEVARSLAARFGCSKLRQIVPAAAGRRAALESALNALAEEVDKVVIHEVARPCVTPDMIGAVARAAQRGGAAVTVSPVAGPVRYAAGRTSLSSKIVSPCWSVESPQSYAVRVLRKGLSKRSSRSAYEHEIELAESAGAAVRMVASPIANLRIQTPDDLALAAQLLR